VKAHEEPAADDVVLGCMKLEQKQLACGERFEGGVGRWFPEIDLVDPWLSGQTVKPVSVSDANIDAHELPEMIASGPERLTVLIPLQKQTPAQ
jgi:hypothetical protein